MWRRSFAACRAPGSDSDGLPPRPGTSQSEISEIKRGREIVAYDVLVRPPMDLARLANGMGPAYDDATLLALGRPTERTTSGRSGVMKPPDAWRGCRGGTVDCAVDQAVRGWRAGLPAGRGLPAECRDAAAGPAALGGDTPVGGEPGCRRRASLRAASAGAVRGARQTLAEVLRRSVGTVRSDPSRPA
jgi:hypothetical protein